MAKTVCIIGAGPSGLVAAKTLTHAHPPGTFHVTVFEALPRIGGLWPISPSDSSGMVNPDMCTNQSKHTVSFSDLAWDEDVPAFPKAWQVGRYLERYVEVYRGYEIRRGCKVVRAELMGEKWVVRTREGTVEETSEFDHLIVGTGFFGKAKVPQILEGFKAPVVHSSRVRDVKDLLTNGGKAPMVTGRNIVVVGGQMSGVEIAAAVALQLSSAENTPGESSLSNASEYYITHIVQNPVWVMTLFFPKDPVLDIAGLDGQQKKESNNSPSFLPVDLVSYNLGWRPEGPVQNSSGCISPEAANKTHNFMNTYLGTDQSEFGSPYLAIQGDTRSNPPFVTVSDGYHEFVRAQKIKIVKGKVTSNEADALQIKDGSTSSLMQDVAAVILATGFDATPSLDFLPTEMLSALEFDPTSDAFPLALNIHSTVNAAIPSLGFVGFYRSPYWGVMEMQARYLGKLWSGDAKAASALAKDTTLETMLKLRTEPRRAQFPMGDYAFLMESFSSIMDIKRTEPGDSTGRTGLVLPSRYLPDSASATERKEAASALSIIDHTITASAKTGKYVARAAFRAMQGDWTLQRTITSRIATYPSGTLSGTASFKPRFPTDPAFDAEYLYIENGEFSATNGLKFGAKRSYVHRYTSSTDTLSVWFTKPDHKTVDYLFHALEIIPPVSESDPSEPWRAKSSHLCIEDLYDVAYAFSFKGVGLEEWSLEYSVKGPQKDYTIRSVYRR
ncbi:Flavin-containing monooxygenase FMO GS-OX-like [Lachnellula hyalina]|uniref:Flavin-containing monooxygenase FMO GS-OX-like n=1 Tax=Lachnellula hyalina TaxID=1316788 RepID=A0A8H8R2U2_9HELO|nr:Flavin-containing monooxygenase FMO GS-OX-like [Lachnellula hyalina]TVY27389.1 Flavin-containing monooxygenase FMO GS-OX-like [Lachnellula hyalina]